MSEPLRNIEQAAAWLGISKETLRRYVTQRSVPFTWVGKHVRFAQKHLDAVVEAGEEPVVAVPVPLRIVGGGVTGPRPPAGPSTPPPPPGPKHVGDAVPKRLAG